MTPLLNAAPTVTGPGNPGAASYAAGYVPANEAWLASFRRPRNGLALGGGSAAPSQPAAPVASPAAAWDTLRRMAMGGGRDEANSLVRDRAGMLGSERWTTPDWQGSFGSWAANALSGAMMPFGGVLAPAALVGTTGTQRPRGAFERLTDWALGGGGVGAPMSLVPSMPRSPAGTLVRSGAENLSGRDEPGGRSIPEIDRSQRDWSAAGQLW